MSVPAGYRAWCHVVGLDPFHPEGWHETDRRAYQAWALMLFREKWRWAIRQGMPKVIRQQSGRQALINQVASELREAMRPLVRNPWGACPCHPRRVGTGQVRQEPWQDKEDYVEGLPSRNRVLQWLDTEFRSSP